MEKQIYQTQKTAQDLFKALLNDYYFDMHEVNYIVLTDKYDIDVTKFLALLFYVRKV